MQKARVRGRATSTVKHPSLDGRKLLVCDLLDAASKPSGDPVLVLDSLGAGGGDTVVISSDGQGLRELLRRSNSPARWWTVGIVD